MHECAPEQLPPTAGRAAHLGHGAAEELEAASLAVVNRAVAVGGGGRWRSWRPESAAVKSAERSRPAWAQASTAAASSSTASLVCMAVIWGCLEVVGSQGGDSLGYDVQEIGKRVEDRVLLFRGDQP